MKEIDARDWDKSVRDALANAAATGGAIFQVFDNRTIVVIDKPLWDALRSLAPSLPDAIAKINRED